MIVLSFCGIFTLVAALPHYPCQEVKKLLDSMLENDIIEPAKGPWASPIVLVTKKDGSTRFCVDFRQLNSVTRKDAHPIPRIDESLDALHEACWFSTLDLASGYWQVGVVAEDREKTAFSTPFGLYQFCVMPFGLGNAPSTFHHLQLFCQGAPHKIGRSARKAKAGRNEAEIKEMQIVAEES